VKLFSGQWKLASEDGAPHHGRDSKKKSSRRDKEISA
jgi:hypothetical protein